jgi:glucose/mannose-6-phosphate isomerase
MIFCISSGGALIKYAQKLGVPYLQVPGGIPPRAASPYLLVPLLVCLEKAGLVAGVMEELNEAVTLLEKVSSDNSPQKPAKENFAKTLAQNIGDTVPVVYGFGFYRSVAQRFKQQFNENSKVPAKWEYFPELNHNETVGWKNRWCFSIILIRDKEEPSGIKRRIEITKQIMSQADLKMYEIWAQGKGALAKMISTMVVGDFTSVYLAVLHGVDPTPVAVINHLKGELEKNGVKEKIIAELEKF